MAIKSIPTGVCKCGCGQQTSISDRGPRIYVDGHYNHIARPDYKRFAACHPQLRHQAKGLCKSCYWKSLGYTDRDQRRYSLKRYGITVEQYDAMLAAQSGACAICGDTQQTQLSGRRLSVDHDHKTGRVRGLLCNSCNRAAGWLRDSPDLALKLATYLDQKGR